MSLPVLIVSFSRLENVIKLIDQLYSQGVRKIYLAIDGPSSETDCLQVKIESDSHQRAAMLNIDLRIWRREFNLGPAVSVITAVDWFFLNEKCGVVLEDDLILSDSAIKFFEISLSCFSQNKSVFLISGSNYFDELALGGKIPATHYPVIWGWASWSDRWMGYRMELNALKEKHIFASRKESWFWKTGLRRCLNGTKDAWDIPLATYQQSHKYLSILPTVNLVSNCGADQFARNTLLNRWPLNVPLEYMSDYELNRISAEEKEFDSTLIETIDLLFREKIYGIDTCNPLPPIISMVFDYFRYPFANRKRNLLERLGSVKIPTW